MICVEDIFSTILVVSEKGYGKRTFLNDPEDKEPVYRITNRGGKGVKTIHVTDKTGSLVGMLDVAPTEDIMITCKSGVTIRMPVSGISEQGRATQGVKLIKIDEGDDIAAITNLDDQQQEEAEGDSHLSTEGDASLPDNTDQPTV